MTKPCRLSLSGRSSGDAVLSKCPNAYEANNDWAYLSKSCDRDVLDGPLNLPIISENSFSGSFLDPLLLLLLPAKFGVWLGAPKAR